MTHSKQLSAVCSLITDGTHYTPPDTGSGVPFLTVKDIDHRGTLDFDRCSKITADEYERAALGNSAPQLGDVLFSKDGTVGKVSVVRDRTKFAVLSSIAILRPDAKLIDPNYLGHALRSPDALDQALKKKTGSAIRRIILSDLKSVQISVPSLPEQRRIAAILDKADALRAKRREAIAKLDQLLYSVFLDMFGDPVTNPKGWPECELGDVVHSAKDGPHVSPNYSEAGIPFLSARHIRAGVIRWEDLKYISEADAEIQWRKCQPQRGDILYTKGGTTGFAAVVDTDEAFAVWVHVALLKTNFEKANPAWLAAMLNSKYCYEQSQHYTHGIANRDLGLKRMVRIKMFHPPLDHQMRYAKLTEMAGLLRERLIGAERKLSALFSSIQTRAFAGTL